MKECLFCRISFQEENKYWENKYFYAVFDQYPVSPGHSLLIPKEHTPTLHLLKKVAWNSLKNSISEVIKQIEQVDLKPIYQQILAENNSAEAVWFAKKNLENKNINKKPDAYNYGINDGNAAGRTISHLHIHIIPRYEGDIDDPRGGVRYVIPSMGNYKIKREN